MSDIKIGTSDRGVWDKEDSLNVQNQPMRTGLTAKEAQDFVLSNPGSEVIIKEKNGKYSVYQLKISEEGKTITNEDFKDRNINLTKDIANLFGGTKAYVATDDNVIRSLEIEGIELKSLDQDFITADLNIIVQDKDGIDVNSKNDMEGTISGKILIRKELLEYALAQGNKNAHGVKFNLTPKPGSQEYSIDLTYKSFTLGRITLKMEQGGIRTKIESAGVIGTSTDYASYVATFGQFDVEEFAARFVEKNLSKELGLKVSNLSKNEFKLEPDFKNNKLINNILVGDMKLNLEEIQSDPSKTSFRVTGGNDLEINLSDLKIIGSSDATASNAVPDKEGQDELTASVGGRLNNDFSSRISTNMGVKVTITSSEQSDMSARIKKLTGKDININGSIEVTDVKATTELDSSGNVTYLSKIPGKVKIKDVNIDLGIAKITLNAGSGNLEAEQKDKKVILRSNDVNLNGFIDTERTRINFKELKINQELVYDSSNPNKFEFNGNGNAKLTVTADVTDKKSGSKIKIDNLKVQGAKATIDIEKGQVLIDSEKGTNLLVNIDKIEVPHAKLSNVSFSGKLDINTNSGKAVLTGDKINFTGKIGNNVTITNLKGYGVIANIDTKKEEISIDASKSGVNIDKIEMPGAKITKATFKGKLDANTKTGKMVLYGDKIDFTGKIGSVDVKSLKASGKVTYDPDEGIRVERGNFDASGKIGGFDIAKLKGKGDIILDKNGALILTSTSDVELDSGNGLNVKGDLKVGYKNGIYNFKTTEKNPINLSYASKGKDAFNVSDLIIEGNVLFNEKTGVFSFNGDEHNLKIDSGNVGGIELKDFNVSGEFNCNQEVVTINNSKGPVTISGKIGVLNLKELKSTGAITYNNNNNTISWDKDVSVAFPDEQVQLNTSGNIEIQYNEQKQVILTSKGGIINGSFGDITLKDFKLDGKIIYDTKTKTISFEGINSSVLKASGKLNSRELDVTTTGVIKFSETENYLQFSGQNIKVHGTFEGFSLKSLSDVCADVSVSKKDKKIDISKFKYDFQLDGVTVSNKDGYIKENDLGYEIKLSGNVSTSEQEIINFVQKVAKNFIISEDTKKSINTALTKIKENVTSANIKNANYENLTLKVDKQFNLQSIEVKTNGTLTDTNVRLDIGDKNKPRILNMNMGQVDFVANASADDNGLKVKNGDITFTLNDQIRNTIKGEVKRKLAEFGLKDIDLDVSQDGSVKIKNATYEIFSTPLDKLGKDIGKAGIPIISPILGRVLRLTDISADIKLSMKVENKKMVVSVDETTINEFIAFLATKLTDALGVTDMRATAAKIAAKKFPEYISKKDIKGNIISIDLQKLISPVSKDFTLNDINISPNGQVNINFDYKKALK